MMQRPVLLLFESCSGIYHAAGATSWTAMLQAPLTPAA
jgi:hypothetical protein